jgi:hypothetical protein
VSREKIMNIQDQYIRNIKFGISEIDTNMSLKRFIVKQNDRKFIQTDQTKKDIRMYMENLLSQRGTITSASTGGHKNLKDFEDEENEGK